MKNKESSVLVLAVTLGKYPLAVWCEDTATCVRRRSQTFWGGFSGRTRGAIRRYTYSFLKILSLFFPQIWGGSRRCPCRTAGVWRYEYNYCWNSSSSNVQALRRREEDIFSQSLSSSANCYTVRWNSVSFPRRVNPKNDSSEYCCCFERFGWVLWTLVESRLMWNRQTISYIVYQSSWLTVPASVQKPVKFCRNLYHTRFRFSNDIWL